MEHDGENVAALLTPPGAGAIAVVRLRGPNVAEFLQEHFSARLSPRRCVHGTLRDGDRIIDDPVVVLTGDTADINLHGGEWIVRQCLELARARGFTITDSIPKLLDGDTLLEREMREALPLARTETGLRMLLSQPQMWERIKRAGELTKQRIEQIVDDETLWQMLHPLRCAIVGIPNAGKSTLANQLFGQERSITADIPGTTRDWVGDMANIDGLPVHLLDTPGQRQSADAIEQAAIARSLHEIESADLIIVVLDPAQPLEPEQSDLRRRYPQGLVVVNKIDLPRSWDPGALDAVQTVASAGTGIDALRRRILAHFKIRNDLSPRWWTQRQRDALRRALVDPASLDTL